MEGEGNVGGEMDDQRPSGNETAPHAADQQRAQFGVDRHRLRSVSPTDRSGLTLGNRLAGRPASPVRRLHLGEQGAAERFNNII
jgi:hypothetical protein